MLCCDNCGVVDTKGPAGTPPPRPPPEKEKEKVTPQKREKDVNLAEVAAALKQKKDEEARTAAFKRKLMAQRSRYVVPRVHVTPSVSESSVSSVRDQLRLELKGSPLMLKHRDYAFDDGTLRRFLTARENDVVKAKKLLQQAVDWREEREPFVHDYAELEREGRTGKVRVAEDVDRWGRSVVVFDNTVQNTKDDEANMRFLAFNLEHALRKMQLPTYATGGSGGVSEKYVVFMRLEDFSLLNNPSWKVTKETCLMLMACFAECCGNIIVYGAPRVFYGVFAMCKPFIDPTTAGKILFCSSKSEKDAAILADVIGPNWRQLTGAGMEKETSKSSPGYRHRRHWAKTLRDEMEWRKKTGNKGPLKHDLKNWPGPDDTTLDLTMIFPSENKRLSRRQTLTSDDSIHSMRRFSSGSTLALPRDETKDDLTHSFDSTSFPLKRTNEDRLRDDISNCFGDSDTTDSDSSTANFSTPQRPYLTRGLFLHQESSPRNSIASQTIERSNTIDLEPDNTVSLWVRRKTLTLFIPLFCTILFALLAWSIALTYHEEHEDDCLDAMTSPAPPVLFHGTV